MGKLFSIVLLIFCCVTTSATHIINGNMQYRYIGLTPNGNEVYEVSLIVYRDCDVSQVGFEDSVLIAVYKNDSQKNLHDTLTLKLTKEEAVTPFIYPSGNVSAAGCYKRGFYTFTFIAPKLHKGFYVVWQRCCRRSLNNIADDEGITALALIPEEGIRNNSPYVTNFRESMIMGSNVFAELDFSNSDADGDSLVYELSAPLNGLNTNNPIRLSYPSTLPPFSTVSYRTKFSPKFPVTIQVPFNVDAVSGKTTIYSTLNGIYLIGITVSEYRNGKLLARYNREHILLFLGTNKSNGINLDVKPYSTNALECKWNNTTQTPVQRYELLKRKAGVQKWDTIAVTGLSYLDSAIEIDTLYEYVVRGVKQDISWFSLTKQGKNSFGVFVNELNTNAINIYPNPTANTLFIESDEPLSTVVITDLAGKTLLAQQYTAKQGVDVSSLGAGTYILQVMINSGIATAKFYKH